MAATVADEHRGANWPRVVLQDHNRPGSRHVHAGDARKPVAHFL
jgi:hypothetical protein